MTPLWLAGLIVLAGVTTAPAQGSEGRRELKQVVPVQGERTLEPGYPVGDAVVEAPEVADLKVLPGRRQLVIMGKEAGRTSLTIWDQRGVKRDEVQVTVTRRAPPDGSAGAGGAPPASTTEPTETTPPVADPAPRAAPPTGLVEMDKVLFVREQQTFEPGYVLGDIALGAPEVADFKVLPGRRQLLLFGKAPGRTNLTVWDDKRAKRHEILVSVMTREDAQAETELRELLKDFRSVQVRWVRGRLTVIGTVPAAPELEHVARIAEAVGALNLVHVGRPAPPLLLTGPSHDELLRRMLRDFPALRVGRESGQLYVSGAVKSEQDFEIVRRMAAALGAQTIVNVRPDAGR